MTDTIVALVMIAIVFAIAVIGISAIGEPAKHTGAPTPTFNITSQNYRMYSDMEGK